MQTSDELGAAPDVTRLSFLSVTPLPHHSKPYLGISTIVIHFVALPLNSQGRRKQQLYLQLWRGCLQDLGREA